jgi:hypothetical protein
MDLNDGKPMKEGIDLLLEGLVEAKIKFILVGGLAAVAQGAPVATIDVDIVYEQSPENVQKILNFLKSIEAIYRRPDDKVILPRKEHFKTIGHRLFKTRLGPIDILGFIEENKTYNDLVEYSVKIEFFGHEILVLDLKKLVELKRASGHSKDLQQLPTLEETLRQLENQSPLTQGEDLEEGE